MKAGFLAPIIPLIKQWRRARIFGQIVWLINHKHDRVFVKLELSLYCVQYKYVILTCQMEAPGLLQNETVCMLNSVCTCAFVCGCDCNSFQILKLKVCLLYGVIMSLQDDIMLLSYWINWMTDIVSQGEN